MVDGAPTEEIGLARVVSVRPALLSRQNRSVGRSNNTRLVCNEELVMLLLCVGCISCGIFCLKSSANYHTYNCTDCKAFV